MAHVACRRSRVLFVAATLPLCWATRVAAVAPSWVEVKSPNFTVCSDAGVKQARQVALQFEQVRLAFEKLWPRARTTSARPVVILAVRDERALKGLLPEDFERKGGMRPAGYTVSGSDKYYVALRTDVADAGAAGYNPYHLIYHEYIHVLIDLNVSHVPAWFGEGLAEFFGATIVEGDRLVIGKPLPWHIDTLREKPMFDLERLIQVEHGSPEYNENTKAGIFYAQSWALVHMLATDPTNAGSKRLNALLELLEGGQDSQAAARGALGDLPAMDKELRSYVRRYAFRYGRVDADARLDGRGFPSREVGPAEVLALQGDFHVHRGAYPLARPMLEQAAAQDPKLALAQEALGLLAWREHGLAEALPFLERAAALDSGNFLAHYLVALPRVAQGSDEALAQAQAALKRSIELNHDYAPAYDALARVAARRGAESSDALPLARRAVLLAPRDADFRVTVSWLLERGGQRDQAVAEAQRALSVARDDDERRRVQEWLDTLGRHPSGSRLAVPAASDDLALAGADAAQLLAASRRSCDGGSAEDCTALAAMLLGGAAGARDPQGAARAFGQACDAGRLPACAQAGLMLAFMPEVPHDETAAAPYLRKACDGGEARACSGLGVLHMNGQGVKRDLAQAAPLLERGCAADDAMGCLNLAALLEAGAGVKQDAARARELYAKACEKGVQLACAKARPAGK